jgi:hypothetical protein
VPFFGNLDIDYRAVQEVCHRRRDDKDRFTGHLDRLVTIARLIEGEDQAAAWLGNQAKSDIGLGRLLQENIVKMFSRRFSHCQLGQENASFV